MKKSFLRFLSLAMVLGLSVGLAKAADPTVYTSNVTLSTTGGTNAAPAKVKIDEIEYDALKVGSSKAGGSLKITVPANTTTLTFHAAAWNGVTGLSLNITGATVNPASVALTANTGVANSSPFTVTPDNTNEFFSIDLSDITAETTLTFTTSTTKRFVMWGVNAETSTSGVTVTKPTFDPAGGLVAVGTSVSIASEGNTVYVASDTQLSTLPPTAEQVVASGAAATSITVTADATYYAVAKDSEGDLSSVASATFSVLQHAGTEADPYTVADAIKVANAAGTTATTENYYVTGYVCDNPTTVTEGMYTFNMTDAENVSDDQLKAYNVSYEGTIEQGDKVVVCGPLCMYYTTPEFNTGEVISVTSKPNAEIAWSSDNFTYTIGKSEVSELPTLANPNNVEVSYKSDNEEVATIAADGTVTINKYGTANITATFAGNTAYKAAIVTYTLTVVDPSVIEDVVTIEKLERTDSSTGYGEWSYTSPNGITYGAYATKNNSEIQLNNSSTRNTGVFITGNVNNYVLKSIKISYKSGKSLDILAKNEAYSQIADLASDETKGVQIGTWDSDTKDAIIPENPYSYIGIIPSITGATYIYSITYNWERTNAFTYKNETITDSHEPNVIAKDEEGNWVTNGISCMEYDYQNEVSVDVPDHYLSADVKAMNLYFTRALNNYSAWHALYLPFDVNDRDMLASRVIEFTGVEKVGNEISLKFTPVADKDPLLAHNLYLFMPQDGMEDWGFVGIMEYASGYDFTVKANPATDTSVSFESDGVTFTLTGNYKNLKGLKSMNAYALKDGNFMKAASDEVVLKPFRVYLTATNSDGTPWTPTSGADKIRVKVDDEATGIESVASDAIVNSEDCYNLQGIRVENPTKGLYIRNGKKFYVK